MKLVTYRDGMAAEARLGVVQNGLVIDVEYLGDAVGAALPSDMLTLIDLGPDALAAIARALSEIEGARPAGLAVPEENLRLLAPIPRPRKNIFGIGLNYVEHVAESAKSLDTSKDLPKQPVVFSKPPALPPNSAQRVHDTDAGLGGRAGGDHRQAGHAHLEG